MKLIESKAELLPWEPGIEGVYKAIERAGKFALRYLVGRGALRGGSFGKARRKCRKKYRNGIPRRRGQVFLHRRF